MTDEEYIEKFHIDLKVLLRNLSRNYQFETKWVKTYKVVLRALKNMTNWNDLFFYPVLWTSFGIVHSILASNYLKGKIPLNPQPYL